MILRAATTADCADLAILDDIAGHGLPLVLWQNSVSATDATNALEYGRQQFLVGKEGACWKNATIAEVDDEVAGSAVGYVMPVDADLTAKPGSILHPIFSLFMQAAGAWIIDALAVYSRWRNQGIAEQLLANQIFKATGKEVYLVAADDNLAALKLYKKHGFAEVTREVCIPFSPTTKTKNWLLMRHNNA